MLAVKSMDIRDNFKNWCDKVSNGETLVVSRPKNDNVVIISESVYNELLKAKRNYEYLAKLDRSFTQLQKGEVVTLSMEALEAMANNDE